MMYFVCLQSRELEIAIFWRDWRQMSAVKFLKLEDFLDNQRHGIAIHLEPQGILFAEVNSTLLASVTVCKSVCVFVCALACTHKHTQTLLSHVCTNT